MPAEAASLAERGSQRKRLLGTLGTTFAIQGTGLVTGALLARLLGVHDRGVLAALVLWPSIVAYLGDLGGPLAYAYISAGKNAVVPKLVGNAFLITAIQATLLVLVGIPVVAFGLRGYGQARTLGFIFLGIYLPLNLLSRYLNSINQGLRRFTAFNAVRFSVQVSYAIGIVVLWIAHLDILAVVIGVILFSNVVATTLAAREVFRHSGLRVGIDLSLVRKTFGYGLRAHLGNLTPVDAMQLDLATVVVLLGPRSAGLYAVATSAAMVVRAQGSAFGMVALPQVAASADAQRLRTAVARILRLSFWALSATALLIVAGAPLFVPLIYGSQFAAAVPIVRVLAVGMVAAALRQVLGDCLRGAGRPLAATAAEMISWIVAILGLLFIVPRTGPVGAAIAVSLAYATALTVSLSFARKLGIGPRDLLPPRDEITRFLRRASGLFVRLGKRARLRPLTPSPRRDVVVANPGAGYWITAVAVGLAEAGLLREYVAPFVFRNPRVPVAFRSVLPASVRRRIEGQLALRQVGDSLNNATVRQRATLLEAAYVVSQRLAPLAFAQDPLIRLRNQAFDRQVARELRKSDRALVGAYGAALRSFHRARAFGIQTFLQYPIAHHVVAESILKDESTRRPDYASTLQFHELPPWLKAQFEAEIALADFIFVLSSFQKRTFVEAGVDEYKLLVTPLGVDLDLFKPPREKRTSETFRVIFVGQITQRKGISYLFESFQRAALANSELLLVGRTVGSTAIWPAISSMIHIPQVPLWQLPELYGTADVLVLPSLVEGFPQTALQAMACGVPVIVSDNTFGTDVITDGVDGYVVPIRNVAAIVDRLQHLYHHPAQRETMGIAARRRAEHFSWRAYSERTSQLIGMSAVNKRSDLPA